MKSIQKSSPWRIQKKRHSRQEEFLKYQIDEIKRAKLRDGEDEELERERQRISFSEKLKEYSTRIHEALHGSDSARFSASALASLNEALQTLRKLVELDSSLNTQLDFMEKTVYGIEEVARDVQSYSDKLEHDPGRLEEIESRLELIRNLQRKYGHTIKEIVGYQQKAENELTSIGLSSGKRLQLEQERSGLIIAMGQKASELSRLRSQAARQLMLDVAKEAP